MKKKLIWMVVNVCRLAVSATFIISGLVKLIDPRGTEYKIHDYLMAMDLEGALTHGFLPLVLAVLMSLVEFCLGVYLLFGIRRRLTLSAMFVFMLFYTPLTLWLAMTDAVADCGCFGDAIKLTNWQTFLKNIILLLSCAFLWWQRRRIVRFFPESAQWMISLLAFCAGLFLALRCIYDEPVVDFRPFRVGQHIPTAMQWPEDPNKQPEIVDFVIEPFDFEGAATQPIQDVEDLLAENSDVFLLTMPHVEMADDANLDAINSLYDYAHQSGYRFLALTSSGEAAIMRWRDMTGAEYDFAFMDELPLKTVARSNPALVFIHEGTIMGKWSHRHLPSTREIEALRASEPKK